MTQALRKTEMQQQLAKSAEGVPLIGWFVYWSISNVKADYKDLVNLMASIGLDLDAATPIRGKSAFITAVEDVAKSIGARHQKIIDNVAKCVYIMVKTHVDQVNENATFTTETKVIYNKAADTLEVEGPYANDITEKFEDYRKHYYSDQFREMVLRLLNKHCEYLTIRDRGGIYFVPSVHEDGLKLIQTLFKHFPECFLDTVGVANMGEARKSMWRTLVGEVTEEISKLKDDLSNAGPDMSDRNMQVRLDRYKALKEKVENYEFVLSGTAEALKSDIGELSRLLQLKMTT